MKTFSLVMALVVLNSLLCHTSGAMSQKKGVVKISDLDQVQKVEYFYGLRVPNRHTGECGSPNDFEKLRVQIDLKTLSVRVGVFERSSGLVKYKDLKLSKAQVASLQKKLSDLTFSVSEQVEPRSIKKDFVSEELIVQYPFDHKPFLRSYFVQSGLGKVSVKDMEKTDLESFFLKLIEQ